MKYNKICSSLHKASITPAPTPSNPTPPGPGCAQQKVKTLLF